MKDIEVYTLVLKNKTNHYSFNTSNKYPKNVKLKDIKDLDEHSYPINILNMDVHNFIEGSKEVMTKVQYGKYLTNLHDLYDKRIKGLVSGSIYTPDEKKFKSLDDIKKWIESEYVKGSYSTYLNGSMSEAYESGEEAGHLQILYKIGKKLGLKMNPPPSQDLDEEDEWNGKITK